MADPLGNTVDLRAKPVRDLTACGDPVREELIGWYVRMCDRNAEDARKEYKQWSNPHEDGTEYLERAQAWEGRAEAARRGMFLYDTLAQRDPEFASNAAIKGLHERASALG
jgi:hypothetical protein